MTWPRYAKKSGGTLHNLPPFESIGPNMRHTDNSAL